MARLLVVSDLEAQRDKIVKHARLAGFRDIDAPESWLDALKYMASPLAAVVDLELWEGMDGIDYIRQFHISHPNSWIVALTGEKADEQGIKALGAGAVDFINTEWTEFNPWEMLQKKLLLYLELYKSDSPFPSPRLTRSDHSMPSNQPKPCRRTRARWSNSLMAVPGRASS